MKSTHLLFGLIIATACSTQTSPAVEEARGSQLVAESAVAASERLVAASLPGWDPVALLERAQSLRSASTITEPTRVASIYTTEPLKFAEATRYGDTWYETASGIQIGVNERVGRASVFAHNRKFGPPSAEFTLEVAKLQAWSLFKQLNLDSNEADSLIARDVGAMDQMGNKKVVARHVRIHRRIEGMRVIGSQLMATFALDGGPLRITARWPAFRLKGCETLISRDRAVREIAARLARRVDVEKGGHKLAAQLAWHFDELDTAFEPVLMVTILDSAGVPTPMRLLYSLVRGGEVSPEKDAPVDS